MRKSLMKYKGNNKKGGNIFNPANYSSSDTGVKGVGCTGTSCNILAANAVYKQNGGGVNNYSTIGETSLELIGPKSGHAAHFMNKTEDIIRDANAFPSKIIGGKRIKKRSMKKRGTKRRSMKKRGTKRRSTKRRSMKKRGTKRRSTKRRSMKKRKYRGGEGPQPYSNTPISFGQEFNTKLDYQLSALATPPPLSAINNCISK
jgi:hypothetical protein